MADYSEVKYGDYVEFDNRFYLVFGDDWEHRGTKLVSIDDLETYGSDMDELVRHVVSAPTRQLKTLPPVKVEKEVLRSLFRLEVTPWELVRQGKYPFGSVTGKFEVTEEDILAFAAKLLTGVGEVMIDTWSENFSGDGLYMHASYPKKREPGFSLGFLCEQVLELMDYYDSYEDDWRYIETLTKEYLKSKGKPLKKIRIDSDLKSKILNDIEEYAKKHVLTEEMREYYAETLEVLCAEKNPFELHRKGYAYYGGNGVVSCDWKKSEEALRTLFELNGDPYVANSLGYIYYSDRLGAPDYENAFYYFDYASGHGVVEASYKLSDMYRKGHGTEPDPDKAWGLLMQLYEWCNKKKKDKGKYPDIMLRIGYCYRDGISVARDIDKARECFNEAKTGIELRIKKHKGFGDEVVLKNILKAISELP